MATVVELIARKRDGGELADDEIKRLIEAFTEGSLPDYQMSALCMAIFFRGMSARETATWTHAMLRSGTVMDLESAGVGPGRVDKHSTGGVGDKISLPLAPAAAACGVKVPMIAGRGLGHTGGTIDKLESIPGYDAALSAERVAELVGDPDIGCVITGQTAAIAPADKRLYALRDVTGTVESIPLITASIMSKKLAEGIEGLVLDVKVGRGAFMKDLDAARRLAESMVAVAQGLGTRVVALLTRMEEPLGRMVGNANEVRESLEILDGGGPSDVRELVVSLGGAMVELARGVDAAEGRARVAAALDDGRARARFEAMVAAQGGDLSRLVQPTGETAIVAPAAGYVQAIDGLEVGLVGVALGAGRRKVEDSVDHRVGIRIDKPVGARVEAGAPLATVLQGDGPPDERVQARLAAAFSIGDEAPEPTPLVIERLD